MLSQKEFPLILWEETKEAQSELEKAEKRLRSLEKRLTSIGFCYQFLGELRFDRHGRSEVWLYDRRRSTFDYETPKTVDEALEIARKFGDTGWWNLDDIEQLIEGKGHIIDAAMWDMGYKKSKKDSSKWIKIKSGERKENPLAKIYLEKHGLDTLVQSKSGPKNLTQVSLTPQNIERNLTFTQYSIMVGDRGMVCVRLYVDPKKYKNPEERICTDINLRNQGIISPQQKGFIIEACNLDELVEEGIYLKAIKPNGKFRSAIWPPVADEKTIYKLASSLKRRIKRA